MDEQASAKSEQQKGQKDAKVRDNKSKDKNKPAKKSPRTKYHWTDEDKEHLIRAEALYRMCEAPPSQLDVKSTTEGNFNVPTLVQTHASELVNDFKNPELWHGSFPSLLVLGQGGLGQTYEQAVSSGSAETDEEDEEGRAEEGDEETRVSKFIDAVHGTAKRMADSSILSLKAGAQKYCKHYSQIFARHRVILAMAFNVIQRKTAWETSHWSVSKNFDEGDLDRLQRIITSLTEKTPSDVQEQEVRKLEELATVVADRSA